MKNVIMRWIYSETRDGKKIKIDKRVYRPDICYICCKKITDVDVDNDDVVLSTSYKKSSRRTVIKDLTAHRGCSF